MDRAGAQWAERRARALERGLAHPWLESAKFCAVYATGWITVQLVMGRPIVATVIRCGISFAIVGVLLGLSLRGGWHRRVYRRRIDRLYRVAISPPPAWYPDPSGRHELRFWNGQRWTDFAIDGGVHCADPLPEP